MADYFVTGTDTDIGKTLVCEALLHKAAQQGLRTIGLKPLAAGAVDTGQGLQNEDALRLQQAATIKLPYSQVNPVALAEAIAPHIAAQKAGKVLSASRLAGFVRGAMMQSADLRLVEGAGGWLVPLNPREMLSELPRQLQLDVILVVGMKLGCLNHALLTARAIAADGLNLAGWVATQVDADMPVSEENLASLKSLLPAPCLGYIPYQADIDGEKASAFVTLPQT